MFLTDVTMNEFARMRQDVSGAIFPLGVVEQHGPHLPLGLDAMHAQALAAECAKLHPCFVAPPLFYGLCRSTRLHPGTLSIPAKTLISIVYHVGASLSDQKIKYLCLLTGHAGGTHQAALTDAGEMLLKDTGLEVAVVCVLDLLDEAKSFLECPKDSHAGEVETSLAMHLWPELVKGTAPEEYPTIPRFILVRDKVSHWPGGVWGDPGKASAEKGAKILDVEARALAGVMDDLKSRL